jgi:hypothetical protein
VWPPPPPDLTDEIQSRLRTRVKEGIQKTRESMRDRRDTITSRLGGDHNITAPIPADLEISDMTRPPMEVPQESDSNEQPVVDTSNPGDAADTKAHADTMHPLTERGEGDHHPAPRGEPRINPSRSNPGLLFSQLHDRKPGDPSAANTTLAQCDIPLRIHTGDRDIEIDTQCQIYATNAQLCHPWVSPILGYLGGLPPLLICAGQNEVLRDEIIYV